MLPTGGSKWRQRQNQHLKQTPEMPTSQHLMLGGYGPTMACVCVYKLYVCVCALSVYLCVSVYAHTCGGQRLTSDIFLHHCPP